MTSVIFTLPKLRGAPWTASREAVSAEIEKICRIDFFSYENHELRNGILVVEGELARRKQYGGTESMRIRVEYPDDFPMSVPTVFDHDKVFEPSAAGHQFTDFSLCLHFPPRGEFSEDASSLIREVIGAAFNWMVKRNIFERSAGECWPGETEEHGYARPYRRLAMESAIAANSGLVEVWVEWALDALSPPRINGDCPCLSGKRLGQCHKDLAKLLSAAVYWARQEPQR